MTYYTCHGVDNNRHFSDYAPMEGEVVRVGKGYMGSGHFATDGAEGHYVVVRSIGDQNYKLRRVSSLAVNLSDKSWDLIVHGQRIWPLGWGVAAESVRWDTRS